MARIPRKELVASGQVSVFHTVNQCLAPAQLAGADRKSGESLEHRRKFIIDRLQLQSELLCVEVLAFAVEPHRIQMVLRTRPDLVKQLTETEIARRYLGAIPPKHGFDQVIEPPTTAEVRALVADRALLARARTRLSDLSWFVSQISESVARNSNRESGAEGKFWEGRFTCRPILDEHGLALAASHVDLAPVLSGEATTAAGCKGTSLAVRLQAARAGSPAWVCSIAAEPGRKAEARRPPRVPAGRIAGLEISDAEYREVLEWTCKELQSKVPGRFPSHLTEEFISLELSPDSWLRLIREFQEIYKRVVGAPSTLDKLIRKTGRQHLQGAKRVRELFG